MPALATLADQFRGHVARLGDAPCLIGEREQLSWREVDRRSDAFAARLIADHQVKSGDTVGLLMRNTVELVVAFLGVQKLGAITSCLNTRVSAGATLSTVELEAHRLLICGEPFTAIAEHERLTAAATDVLVVEEGSGLDVESPVDLDLAPVSPDVDAPCNIIHTSGTTGDPKGAAFTHATQTLSGLQYALEMGIDRTTVGMSAAPIVIGAATNFFACFTLVVGAPLVLLADATPPAVVAALERHGVGALFAVPTQLHQFITESEQRGHGLEHLRVVRTGGSPVAVELIHRVRGSWHAEVLNTYGTTESCTAITLMHSGLDPEWAWSSIGKASYFQQTRVEFDDDEANERSGRRRGQLLNRGPQSVDTVHLQPERVLKDAEGWQHTRDVVEIDEDGYLYVIDRVDNVIISGGENIYPQAVEQAIEVSPQIADVGVGSVLDREWGELVVAAVVPAHPAAGDIAVHVEETCLASEVIPRHWRPRRVLVVEELPRNILGKIDRVALNELLMATTTTTGTSPARDTAPQEGS